MTSLAILNNYPIPRADIDYSVIHGPFVNTGFQATWLKNPDGVSQGPSWFLTRCGAGCNISPGCDLCLHLVKEGLAKLRGEKIPKTSALPENLNAPFRWRDRKNAFVCPEGDFFHKNISDEFILEAFEVMRQCPQHNFIMTTKRAHRLSVIKGLTLQNAFVGVSVEGQKFMRRTKHLMKLPDNFKKVLFIAPMLAPVVIPEKVLRKLSWIICSPERGGIGRKARPCHEEWQMELIEQAKSYDIPFFLDVKYQPERILRMGGRYMQIPVELSS